MTMKHLRLFLYTVLFGLTFTACGGDDDDITDNTGGGNQPSTLTVANTNANDGSVAFSRQLEFPHLKGGNSLVLVHIVPVYGVNYSTEWDTDKRAQRWSCYQMHAGNNVRNANRYTSDTNQYPNDPFLSSRYQFTSDPYWNTGYDHGHICPSADRLNSEEANIQTFYLTNMQPQQNGFNAGVWENMESQVRNWNSNNFRDTLYVVKGGTIDSEENLGAPNSRGQIMQYIGSGVNRIPVPKYFFMAILCKDKSSANGGYKALAFWVEHKSNSSNDLKRYVVSIDELEQKTGIDFFCNLPDNIENAIETKSAEEICGVWGLK